MGILILALSAAQEALVHLILDDYLCVPAGSCVTVESIGKLPTGYCISVGSMEISILTTFVVQESLVLLLLDDSPLILDLFLFLYGVRKVETSPVSAKGSSSSIAIPFISEEVLISKT